MEERKEGEYGARTRFANTNAPDVTYYCTDPSHSDFLQGKVLSHYQHYHTRTHTALKYAQVVTYKCKRGFSLKITINHSARNYTCKRKLDLVIAVDASSIKCGATEQCPEWNAILQFCKAIVNCLTIGVNDTRVAFLTMAGELKVEWNLAGYTDKDALLAAFGRVVYNGGDIYNLLSSMIFFTDIFNIGSGDRLDVTNVVIPITDGVPLVDFKDTKAVSSALQKIGAKLIPVCIAPGCTESFASGLASEPKQANVTYFLLDSFLSINNITDNLMKQICSYGQTNLF